MIICFWMNAIRLKVYFFQLPKLKKCCLGGSKWRSGPWIPVVKKAQKRLSMALHNVSHSMPQQLQNVIKKQRGKAGY